MDRPKIVSFPRELTDELGEVISEYAKVCGGGAFEIWEAICQMADQPTPVAVAPSGFMLVERGIWTEDQVESAAKCITMLKDVPGMTDRDLAMAAMDAGQCKAPDIVPAPVAVVLPERKAVNTHNSHDWDQGYSDGWAAYDAELKRLNLALGGAPASASNRYSEPISRRPAFQVQGERQAFEQAFVVQEGVYFSDGHGEYRSMNGRSIEQRDASDLNLRLSGWNARASLSNQPQCSLVPQSLRSAMSAIEDEVACMGGNAQSVFTKMRTAVQAHFHGTEPEAPEGASWYAAGDIDQLVRELDVLLNGEGAAPQAKLCDLVAQVRQAHKGEAP